MTTGYIETFRAMVYPWHCDHQNHMTVMHYVGMFDSAFWHQVSALGFTRPTGMPTTPASSTSAVHSSTAASWWSAASWSSKAAS